MTELEELWWLWPVIAGETVLVWLALARGLRLPGRLAWPMIVLFPFTTLLLPAFTVSRLVWPYGVGTWVLLVSWAFLDQARQLRLIREGRAPPIRMSAFGMFCLYVFGHVGAALLGFFCLVGVVASGGLGGV